ncbi:TrkA family potassium uptake protein [Roseiflexus sp.]|uniref:potassium channel family protein n=1 Tax=Roseiflexus TaxID=120961 RepID=UPI000CB5B6BC|nr:NAD-binding protein [Roseiflexus sp.]PMP76846.1 MAG: potassium transporter TrkA [Roseiflexus castenholzii]GIW02177.1 MAG: potassium transporter TrkA [Roseiflexus sp.]
MNVLIVGGGKIGRNLAMFLTAEGRHAITLVEKQEQVAHALMRILPDIRVIEGDGCDPSVLREAGAEFADAVAAVTGDDEDNLVIAVLCKREFRVGRVAARINNPKNAWLFTRRMGVDLPIDTAQTIGRGLEADINLGAIVQLTRLREGRISLIEFTVSPESSAVGKTVAALRLPPDCLLTAILRGDDVILPSGETVIQAGDQVIALAYRDREASLSERFQ